jgi:hypothetical protein
MREDQVPKDVADEFVGETNAYLESLSREIAQHLGIKPVSPREIDSAGTSASPG